MGDTEFFAVKCHADGNIVQKDFTKVNKQKGEIRTSAEINLQ